MTSEYYKFRKSYDTRLSEYRYILDTLPLLPSPQITNAWANYIELQISQCGWNALWYILRDCCDKLKIEFPKVAEVVVKSINSTSLTADVQIIDLDDGDDHTVIPSLVAEVPLKDLYVTISQQNPDLDVVPIAESLDLLRIFYHHLWWPWEDHSDYLKTNWVEIHLENRLKLYYDKLEFKVHYVTGKIIKSLLETGFSIHENIGDSETTKSNLEMQKQLDGIRCKLKQWELPDFRRIKDENMHEAYGKPGLLIVMSACTFHEADAVLSKLNTRISRDIVVKKMSATFKDSILYSNEGDTIVLCTKYNDIDTRQFFEFPITVKSIPEHESLVTDVRSDWCLFQCTGENVTFENLQFRLDFSRSIINIRRGSVTLVGVRMQNAKSDAGIAVNVFKGATLKAVDCHFSGFGIAVSCFSDSTVELSNCVFENNRTCLKISKGSSVSIKGTELLSDVPIKYVLQDDLQEGKIESLDYLKKLENVHFETVITPNISKAVELI